MIKRKAQAGQNCQDNKCQRSSWSTIIIHFAVAANEYSNVVGERFLRDYSKKKFFFLKIPKGTRCLRFGRIDNIWCAGPIVLKKKKKSWQPFRNGSKHVNFFPAPKLTSVFSPFCDFQPTIGAYVIKHTDIFHMHGLKMYAKY